MAGEVKRRKSKAKGARVMTTVTSVRFSIDLLQALNTEAEGRDVSTSALINEVLRAHVGRRQRKSAEPAAPALFG